MYQKKIKVTADVHICPQYIKDIEPSLQKFIEEVKKDKPIVTVISGDYFDRRISADEEVYRNAIKYLIEISNNTKYLIVLQGTFSHDYNSLDILKTFNMVKDNIYFVKSKEVLNIEEYKILCLPEEYPENPEEYYKEVLSQNYDYIFGHGDIEGAMLHAGIDNRKLKGFKFSASKLSSIAKQVVFGHIHKHQYLKDNVAYPGSLARFKFGEEEAKGYIEINIEANTMSFVEVQSSDYKTIVVKTQQDLENLNSYIDQTGEVSNLRVKISEDLKDLKNQIDTSKIKDKLRFEYLNEASADGDLIYKDISKLDIKDQYLAIYENEIQRKKITLKKQKGCMSKENFLKILEQEFKRLEEVSSNQ